MTGASARRLLARAVGMDRVDFAALASARRVFGSWKRLAEVLKEERLAPLLYYRLAARDDATGNNLLGFLKPVGLDTLAWNLKLRKDFDALRRALAAAGIPCLPIKGVDVAFSAYPSPACRPATDIDVLVSPDNYVAAQGVLKENGYAPLMREPRWWPGRSFYRKGGMVDLHWSPAAALPPRRGMAALLYLTGCEEAIREEFRLLVAVCHLQNHFFSLPLLYYWEAAWLARRVTWGRYWPLARLWGAARVTRYALAVARSFFEGAPAATGYGVLDALARPGINGGNVGRAARAAAVYAASLDNPMSAVIWAFKKPAWARKVLSPYRNGID